MFKKHWKIISLSVLMFLALTIVIVNVFIVSVSQYHILSQTDLAPYVENLNVYTDPLYAKRGEILDSKGSTIATDSHTFDLYAVLDTSRMHKGMPAHVTDIEEAARLISPIIGMDSQEMIQLMSQDVYQTEFKSYGRGLSLSQKNQIENLGLTGIEFTDSYTRFYPLGVFTSNLIGLARYDDASRKVLGQWGLESVYEDVLQGTNGQITYQRDLYGYVLDETTIEEVPAINGNSIYLTIEQSVQEGLEAAFQSTQEHVEATNLFGAVMETDTGRILAWGQSPSYSPNSIVETNESTFLNYGLQGTFEPGSTFKAITYAAAIDAGAINLDETFDSFTFYIDVDNEGNIVRTDRPTRHGRVRNYDFWENHGWITYEEGFVRSSNTSTASILTQLGDDVLLDYIKAFGFTQPVNPDRFSDVSGYMSYQYPLEKVNTTFGQGLTVSVIQMLQAYSAIMNDGTMVKPHFIDKIVSDQNETIYEHGVEVVGHPIRETTAQAVQDLMHKAIYEEESVAKRYRMDGLELMGKTGTSQIVIDGVYSDEQVISSVMLAFPYENPKYLVYYGFQHDAKVTNIDVTGLKNLIYNLSFKLDNNGSSIETNDRQQKIQLPQLTNHSLSYALNQANEFGLSLEIIGTGQTVKAQLPLGNQEITSSQKVFILTDTPDITMPDMTGWTRKDVTNYWTLTGVNIKISGQGTVVSQSVSAGEKIDPSMTINVILE